MATILGGPAASLPPEKAPAKKRPGSHPQYAGGLEAFKSRAYRKAVVEMWRAHLRWPEDGRRTRTYGRWFEPYLPRYYTGAALYELGCHREALEQLKLSLLNQPGEALRNDKAYKSYRELMSRLASSDVENESEECVVWRDWEVDE